MDDYLRSSSEPMKRGVRLEPMAGGVPDEPMKRTVLFETMGQAMAQSSGSLLAQALAMSTAALRTASEKVAAATRRGHPSTEDRLPRWEPWVRVTMAQQALISGLRYVTGPDGRSGQLWLAESAPPGAGPLLSLQCPTGDVLDDQVQKVIDQADLRLDRLPEILVQVNGFWPFWTSVTNIDPVTAPRTFELLEAAVSLSPAIGMRFKHDLACERPSERSPLVRPVIAVPGHASHPSGHATAAALWVGVAKALMASNPKSVVATQLDALASRIAQNRVIAGLHYPMDSAAGGLLGSVLADYVVAMSTPTGKMNRAHREYNAATGKMTVPTPVPTPLAGCDVLRAMWQAATNELVALGIRVRPARATGKQ